MSLKIWLPLIENTDNQGISSLNTFSYNTLIQQTDGKLGKCYSGQGIYHLENDFLSNEWSLCAWVKSASWSQYNDIILCKNTSTSDNCQFYFSIINGTTLNFAVNAGSSGLTFNYAFATNTWYHVAATYNGSEYALYINGEQKKKQTISTAVKTGMNNLCINCRSTNTAGTSQTGDGGKKLNDVRIYDHALSAAEVHEISQGLVLHYPLNWANFEPIGTNLVTGITAGGQTSALTDGKIGVKTSGTNADTYFSVNLSEDITNGTIYYLSCDVSGVSDGQYWGFPLGAQNNTTMPSKFYNGHNEYVFTANNINWGTKRLFMDDNYRQDYAHQASFYNFMLIKNPIFKITDNSGYSHNGWSINAAPVSSLGRYNDAINCNGTTVDSTSNTLTGAQYFFGNLPLPASSALTVTWWGKNDAYSRGGIFETTSTVFTESTGMNGTDYNTTAISNWDTSFRIFNGSSGVNIFSSFKKDGAWHHHAIVFDATKVYYYCDGVLITSSALTGTLPAFNGIRMGLGRAGGVYRQIKETISDLRIYVTALTADDILELYHTSAKIDNNHNFHTFELVEDQNKISINKRGQTLCEEIIEDTTTKFYKNTKTIKTKQLIEI